MKTRILPVSDAAIREACRILRGGDLVAFPTETVYGLGGHGLHSETVKKIFQAKGRPSTDPLILHLPSSDLESTARAGIVAEPIPASARLLTMKFWPGPLTLILRKGSHVPAEVTAKLDTVAIRFPSHPDAQRLLGEFGHPLAAPSANRFGRISPTEASAVFQELEGKIPLILDGGACSNGIESTVLSLCGPTPEILRPGSIAADQISGILNVSVSQRSSLAKPDRPTESPGMLAHHYAPKTPLYLCALPIRNFESRYQYIVYGPASGSVIANVQILAPDQQPSTAAQNLYKTLRNADRAGSSAILIDPIPDSSWAPALRDRLMRASAGTARWDEGNWSLLPRISG
ncbi:threonylcarbamoyl-AMP synthase [bacterium]|nr:threonylcarbamoyl-AMP synthase [bacterium]NBV96562.1 threonylcarbamoyl-AMP synthase [Verrucomicrobiota bacterium]